MTRSETPLVRVARSRRNVLKVIAIAAGAFAGASTAGTANAKNRRCFLRGTKIRTARGHRRIEDLTVGDLVPTVFGGSRPIKAINSHAYERDDRSVLWPLEARPVRVSRSALADNVPSTDLYLTHSHALYLDGVLVPVGNLVNGSTIVVDEEPEATKLEYFHVEFDKHDVIDVQGALCESLWNPGDRDNRSCGSRNDRAPCAPYLGFNGRRNEVRSRLRSALTLFVDRRQQLDTIRDRLEERSVPIAQAGVVEGHVQVTP